MAHNTLAQKIHQQMVKIHGRTKQRLQKELPKQTHCSPDSLLARNLEFILQKLQNYCKKLPGKTSIRNVLFFFHKGQSKPRFKTPKPFELLKLNYSQKGKTNNFINLN